MNKTGSLNALAALMVAAALITGCATVDREMSGMSTGGRTATGAGVGAAVGAGLGALIGDSSKAALIGAGIGAVAGGVVAYNWSGIKNDVEQSGAAGLGVDVIEMPDGTLKVNIPGATSFDTGKANLKPALLPVLDSVARALIQHPELRNKIIGYTDNTGPLALNQKLSLDRAQSVATYLESEGVRASDIVIEGLGPANPIGDNATAEGRSLNRRVEVFLYAVQAQQ